MKVIILAAGIGSRLDDSQHHLPKTLAKLTPEFSILGFQLHALSAYIPLDQVWVVVGYQKEAIMEAFPQLGYVYNPDFQKENTAKSLLRALRKVDDDVLWLNGDVVFRPAILEGMLQANRTAMMVNQTAVGEEEVKYRADAHGQIVEVSKQVSYPQGEALGINLFKQSDVIWLRESLEQCQARDFFEKGIEKGIQQGKIVWTFPVEPADCAEIDFPADLERAKKLISQWA